MGTRNGYSSGDIDHDINYFPSLCFLLPELALSSAFVTIPPFERLNNRPINTAGPAITLDSRRAARTSHRPTLDPATVGAMREVNIEGTRVPEVGRVGCVRGE